ncbi:D-alanyl-D-alanine carboxypeptidase, partial [Rhodospirillum rubrum]
LYDDTLIASAPEIEPSQPADLAYNPGFGALALDFNRVMLTWDPKGGPRMGEVFDVPPVDSVRFRVSGPQDPPWSTKAGALRYEDTPPPVVTAGLAPMAHPPQTPGESWVLAPTWKGSGSTWLPVKHPGAHVAQVARALAQRDGVTLPPPQPGAAPPRARVIGLSESPPLFEVATAALKHSNNLVAEMIGMTATRRITGRALAPTESAETLAALFRATLPGLDWSTFRLANHSGLTMDSRMTPEQMTAILDYAQLHAFSGLDYAGLLPTRRWGLEDDSDLPETRDGRLPVWAKTGTVYYGRGLAGYIVPRSGHLLAFSFFANDLDKRRTFDEANLHHDGRAIAAARGWLGRARALERDLVERWLATY